MVKLTVDNSECLVEGISREQLRELKELLSYSISAQASFFAGGYKATKRYLIDQKGRFPTGLLYLVKEYLKKSGIKYTTSDVRIIPRRQEGLFELSLGVTPYPEQENAAAACFCASRGIVSAVTGFGKSVVIALIIQKLQVPTLVVVPNLELKKQLTKSLQECFGASKVGKGRPIMIQNVDSLDVKDDTHGYDCVIVDEFHHSGAKTYRKLNKTAWKRTYYKFGLTATPFRSQDNERLLLESVLSEIIYRVDYHIAVKKGYISPIEAYYYEIPTTDTNGNNWSSVYSELVVNNYSRNSIIAEIIRALNSAGVSTLCLVKEIKHGENIKQLLDFDCAFVKGENDNNRETILEFLLKERKTLIGTTGVVGEGLDTKPAEFVIIAGLGKSKNAFMQQIGRVLRKVSCKDSGKVIIFLDKSHKWTKAHFKEQCKILREEYGVEPIKLNY